jgi:hypothetical protein
MEEEEEEEAAEEESFPRNPLCFWSNLLMLCPALLARERGLPVTAGALLVCMVASMLYHLDEDDPRGLALDVASVVGMVACLCYLFAGLPHKVTPMTVTAMAYGLMAAYCFLAAQEGILEGPDGREQFTGLYERNHMAWHVLSTCMTAAIIYSYAAAPPERRTVLTRPLSLPPLPPPPPWPVWPAWPGRRAGTGRTPPKNEGMSSARGAGTRTGPSPAPSCPPIVNHVSRRSRPASSSLSRSNTPPGTRPGIDSPAIDRPRSRLMRRRRASRSRSTSSASSSTPSGSGSRACSRSKRSTSAVTIESASAGS